MKICYQPRDFQPASRRIIAEAADICEDYAAQGYLRQLYYVFVSRDANSIDVDYADGERPDPVFTLERIALNRDQIDRYNPPPNPAKITDSRAEDYIARHGRQSWELDALPPQVLNDLIQAHIVNLIDDDAFDGRRSLEAQYKARIADLLDRHGDVLDEVAP